VQKYLRPSIWQMQPIQVDFSLANKHFKTDRILFKNQNNRTLINDKNLELKLG
jgi:hypothetical protein